MCDVHGRDAVRHLYPRRLCPRLNRHYHLPCQFVNPLRGWSYLDDPAWYVELKSTLLPSGRTASALNELKRRLVDRALRNGLLTESARPEAFLADGGDGEEAERGSLAVFDGVRR
jgi:hypothetical protein